MVQRMREEGSWLFSYFPIGNSVGDFLVSSVGGTKHFTFIIIVHSSCRMTPGGTVVKNLPASAGDAGSIPGSR